jgi:hypothetical protein
MIKFNYHHLKNLPMIGKHIFIRFDCFFYIYVCYFRPSVEVPSYAHLLNHSKSSSNSDADHKKKKSLNDQNRLNNSKSSHNSDGSRTKKKSKKQRVLVSSLSSSSDEDENKSVLLISFSWRLSRFIKFIL